MNNIHSKIIFLNVAVVTIVNNEIKLTIICAQNVIILLVYYNIYLIGEQQQDFRNRLTINWLKQLIKPISTTYYSRLRIIKCLKNRSFSVIFKSAFITNICMRRATNQCTAAFEGWSFWKITLLYYRHRCRVI